MKDADSTKLLNGWAARMAPSATMQSRRGVGEATSFASASRTWCRKGIPPREEPMQSPDLYLPDDALVEVILDARALNYIPSEALVARTIAGLRRPRSRFRMPAHMVAPRALPAVKLTPARAAAVALAAVGLSPGALAAATVVQLLLFAGTGLLLRQGAGEMRAALSARVNRAASGERIIYYSINRVDRSKPRSQQR